MNNLLILFFIFNRNQIYAHTFDILTRRVSLNNSIKEKSLIETVIGQHQEGVRRVAHLASIITAKQGFQITLSDALRVRRRN